MLSPPLHRRCRTGGKKNGMEYITMETTDSVGCHWQETYNRSEHGVRACARACMRTHVCRESVICITIEDLPLGVIFLKQQDLFLSLHEIQLAIVLCTPLTAALHFSSHMIKKNALSQRNLLLKLKMMQCKGNKMAGWHSAELMNDNGKFPLQN